MHSLCVIVHQGPARTALFTAVPRLHVMQFLANVEHSKLQSDADAFVSIAGSRMLTEHLERGNVLLVMDDVDDVMQLESLLPPCRLHPKSLVIVTSRKEYVLTARCRKVCKVQLLPGGCDMQLFEAWAFSMGKPVWDTLVLVPEMVACCGRLPLTLKVGAAHALKCH